MATFCGCHWCPRSGLGVPCVVRPSCWGLGVAGAEAAHVLHPLCQQTGRFPRVYSLILLLVPKTTRERNRLSRTLIC